MIAKILFGYYWLRSRYAAPNAFVRCTTCPNWLFHSRVKSELSDVPGHQNPEPFHDAGLCKLDVPRVFTDYTTGYALRIWTANDSCTRHPLYDGQIVHGSDLQYRPGAADTEGAAGFSRLPTLAEALKMSGASLVKPGEPVPPRPVNDAPERKTGFKLDPRISMRGIMRPGSENEGETNGKP